MEAKDILGWLELSKKKAELDFKKNVLKAEIDSEARANGSEMERVLPRLKGFSVIIPNQRKLDDLGRVLSGYNPGEIKEALRSKSGPAYDAFNQRGMIVKSNYDNRYEIAKLNMELADLGDEDRARLSDVIKLGAIFGPIPLPSAKEKSRERISRFMRRCGIPCDLAGDDIVPGSGAMKEVRMMVLNRVVWVDEGVKKKLEDNLSKTQQVSMKVQLKNAERQVLCFDEEQEKGFADLQQEYLDLLKEQDELLKDFDSEEGKSRRDPLAENNP
jgi:hypothetical protein